MAKKAAKCSKQCIRKTSAAILFSLLVGYELISTSSEPIRLQNTKYSMAVCIINAVSPFSFCKWRFSVEKEVYIFQFNVVTYFFPQFTLLILHIMGSLKLVLAAVVFFMVNSSDIYAKSLPYNVNDTDELNVSIQQLQHTSLYAWQTMVSFPTT